MSRTTLLRSFALLMCCVLLWPAGRADAQGVTTGAMSGVVKDAQGAAIPAHFIQELTFEYDGKAVFVADWGTAVSKDPYVKFAFKGAAKGDELKVSWIDNKGETDTATFKVQ